MRNGLNIIEFIAKSNILLIKSTSLSEKDKEDKLLKVDSVAFFVAVCKHNIQIGPLLQAQRTRSIVT